MHDPLHRRPTGRTGLPLAVIDAEGVLEIAELAIGRGEILQRGATSLDGFSDDGIDFSGQAFRAGLADAGSDPARGDSGPKQGLADIDIAEPGNEFLVQQRGLDRRLFPLEHTQEIVGMEAIAQRLWPEMGKAWIARKVRCRPELHEAEPAWIIIGDEAAALGMEDNMIMGWVRAGLLMEKAEPCILYSEPAGHAEMHDQRLAGGQVCRQEFRLPTKAQHLRAAHPLCKSRREGKAQILSPHLRACNGAAL